VPHELASGRILAILRGDHELADRAGRLRAAVVAVPVRGVE
jgi:hypothetical protein